MGSPVARLGDPSDHGGEIIEGSDDVITNGLSTARIGDNHSCPIPGHGVTPMITGSDTVIVNGRGCCRVGDNAGCGAVIISGSPNVFAG